VKRPLSIAALLAVITGVLVIMLISTFAILAHDGFRKKQSAAKSLAAVQIERDILSAKVALRSESSLVEVGDWPDRIAGLHSKSESGFSLVVNELRSYPNEEGEQGLRRLVDASIDTMAQLASLFRKSISPSQNAPKAFWPAGGWSTPTF